MSQMFHATIAVDAAGAAVAIPVALATLVGIGLSAAVAAALVEAEAGARLVEQEGWEPWIAATESRARALEDAGLPRTLARSRAAWEAFPEHPVPLPRLPRSLSLSRQTMEADLIQRARSAMARMKGSVRSSREAVLRAMQAAIRERPLLRELVALGDRSLLDERSGGPALQDRLGAALLGGLERLEEALMHTSADGWHRALQSLGYTVEEARGPDGIALWATRGGFAIALRITRDGVEGDMAGFQGPACMAEWTRLQQAMVRQGFHIRDVRVIPHNRPEGGALIAQARARRLPGTPMARALLGGIPVSTPAGPSMEADRSQRIRAWFGALEARIGGSR